MQELYVACVTSAIVFPTLLFITFVFRYSQKKSNEAKKTNKTADEIDSYDVDNNDIDLLIDDIYRESLDDNKAENEKDKPSAGKQCCDKALLIAAWIVTNLAVFVSAFFVILYSMEWGGEKSNAWLVSYVLSIIENIFFADPLKVWLNIYLRLKFFAMFQSKLVGWGL